MSQKQIEENYFKVSALYMVSKERNLYVVFVSS